jgi:hypothetical protein
MEARPDAAVVPAFLESTAAARGAPERQARPRGRGLDAVGQVGPPGARLGGRQQAESRHASRITTWSLGRYPRVPVLRTGD